MMEKQNLPVINETSNKPIKFETDQEDEKDKLFLPKNPDALIQMFGSADENFIDSLVNQIIKAHPDRDALDPVVILNSLTPVLRAIGPRDEFESILAAQMIMIHVLSMDRLRVAAHSKNSQGVDSAINQSTKLSRTFVALTEALDKRRNGRQQRMTVEHIHVNKGGQAVIGNVGGKEEVQ